MKLVLVTRNEQGHDHYHVVMDDVTQLDLGRNFVHLQQLEKALLTTYEQAAGKPFPISSPPKIELPQKKAGKCLKPETRTDPRE